MPAPRLVIRPAIRADLPALIALERAAFSTYAISPRQMRYLQQNPNAIFLVARRGGELAGDAIGLVRRNPSGRSSGRIYSLVVDPAHRGQKIGQKLMAATMKALAQRRVFRVYLEVEKSNGGAIRLYEQLGFRTVKPLHHYYGRGNHGVQMRHENAASVPASNRDERQDAKGAK
jgi:ribosomal-protein-alanine N-acetyltransferase